MNFILTLIILLFILGVLVSIHELGHFIAAKKMGIYVYEFCLGMGPKVKGFKRKNDETEYTIRLFPIGGFVAMANERDGNQKLKNEQILANKKFYQKLIVLSAGIIMNLVLALLLLFVSGLVFGSPETKAIIGGVEEGYPAYDAGLQKGDLVLELNGEKVNSWDDITLALNEKEIADSYVFTVQRETGETINLEVVPKKEKIEGETRYVFGISSSSEKEYGLAAAFKYTGNKFVSMLDSMVTILGKLFTGQIGMDKLSGPVGMYTVIDTVKSNGVENIIYLIAFLSVNVGVINIIPIPVFDGGRILLTIIEKIKGGKINPKIEIYLNYFGFLLLIFLMIYVTLNDIIRLL